MNNAGWSLTPRQAGADTYAGRPFGNEDFVSEMANDSAAIGLAEVPRKRL